jgi:hypothetical protein
MMETDLTPVFEELFATNRGPDGARPDYGIRAVCPSSAMDEIQLTLTFKTGRVYCCGEPGCHFAPNWSRLRSIASRSGISLGVPLELHLHGVVEAGSTFTSTVKVGGPEANAPYVFDETYSEQDRPTTGST